MRSAAPRGADLLSLYLLKAVFGSLAACSAVNFTIEPVTVILKPSSVQVRVPIIGAANSFLR